MMEKGEIIESGSHEGLMEHQGAYHRLYTSQQELERYGWKYGEQYEKKEDRSRAGEKMSAAEKKHRKQEGGAGCGE